ncbi:MAG: hypothetical protein ACRC0Q_06595 [Kurthia gibsonii]
MMKQYIDASFKIYIAVFLMIAGYFSIYLFEAILMKKNIYDLLLHTKDMLTISYVIVPLYLILLVNGISANDLNEFKLLRFRNKSQYYHKLVQAIIVITTKFLLLMIFAVVGLSFSALDFKNEWSIFARRYFMEFPSVLQNYSPIQLVIINFSLLWLFLIFLGLIYLMLIIITKSTVFSILGIVILVIFNMAITISHIDWISKFLFTKHLDFVQYVYLQISKMNVFPFDLYLYWFILLIVFYLVSYKLIHQLDLDLKKGV